MLGGAEGRKFKAASAGDALIKLWGCTHREGFRQMIKRDFHGSARGSDRDLIKKQYQQFIHDGTYQFHLHVATGLPVYAAPLGWGASPYLPFGIEGDAAESIKPEARGVFPPEKSDRWWRVSQHFRPDRGREFYEQELRATLDVLDYVAYTVDLVK